MNNRLPIFAFALCVAAQLHAGSVVPSSPANHKPSPATPSKVSTELFWLADTRKTDAFLSNVQWDEIQAGSYAGEVLPDTRVAWRDYAREATALARRGDDEAAAGRLAQMLKLAAVYSSFGGLQNVVQGQEIRYLAGRTATRLGPTVTSLIRSPYLEKDAGDCLIMIEAQAGGEKNQVTASFWHNLEKCAVDSHFRLTSCESSGLAIAR